MTRPRLWVTVVALVSAALSVAWSGPTTRHVAWSAVEFLPPDLAALVRLNHRRFDAGIGRGLASDSAWRAGYPGKLSQALEAEAEKCARDLRVPIPLDDLVENLGVLAVRVLDANDPLAVAHDDPREGLYAAEYSRYVESILDRVRLVYYGPDSGLTTSSGASATISNAMLRSRGLYVHVGAEFFRTGNLRSATAFDDRSLAFGVAGVALSRGLTDFANLGSWIWRGGGGLVPKPRPTPRGHIGPTVTVAPKLDGGFEANKRPKNGAPAMPGGSLALPPP